MALHSCWYLKDITKEIYLIIELFINNVNAGQNPISLTIVGL